MLMYYLSIAGAVLLLFIGWRMLRRILAANRHVSDADLIDFWNGRLRARSEAEYRRVAEHLSHCQYCRDRLDDIIQNNKARHNVDESFISRRF